jgi:hypothetical protein
MVIIHRKGEVKMNNRRDFMRDMLSSAKRADMYHDVVIREVFIRNWLENATLYETRKAPAIIKKSRRYGQYCKSREISF